MKHFRFQFTLLFLTTLLFTPTQTTAGEVRIAVASNFTAAMKEIAAQFEQQSDHRTKISYGSTGKLYAQILHRAPFDLFLSADQRRPALLEKEGQASRRFTYAIGKLALWSRNSNQAVNVKALQAGKFRKIALANPKTAPYGMAALEVMQNLKVEKQLRPKWVRGENIAQTYQFASTGNAQLGFVALVQITLNQNGNSWEIPQSLYTPIRQDAVLLKKGEQNPAATAFLDYLQSESVMKIIRKYGYGTE